MLTPRRWADLDGLPSSRLGSLDHPSVQLTHQSTTWCGAIGTVGYLAGGALGWPRFTFLGVIVGLDGGVLDTLHGDQEQLGERHPESEPFAKDLAS
jgi:hypothetical protein